jgi:hypothetical protein
LLDPAGDDDTADQAAMVGSAEAPAMAAEQAVLLLLLGSRRPRQG